jgi:hypothetical protein
VIIKNRLITKWKKYLSKIQNNHLIAMMLLEEHLRLMIHRDLLWWDRLLNPNIQIKAHKSTKIVQIKNLRISSLHNLVIIIRANLSHQWTKKISQEWPQLTKCYNKSTKWTLWHRNRKLLTKRHSSRQTTLWVI